MKQEKKDFFIKRKQTAIGENFDLLQRLFPQLRLMSGTSSTVARVTIRI
jgi:hypothetical protein